MKANRRLYSLKKIRAFHISASLLAIFYSGVVCSALTFGVVCWGGNISKHERGRLEKNIREWGQVVRISGQSPEEVYSMYKLATILHDSTHPLYSDLDSSRMEGSRRLRIPLARTNRLKLLICAISSFHDK